MGIDFVLEVREKEIQPVFLEINPRPCGFNKLSKFTIGDSSVQQQLTSED